MGSLVLAAAFFLCLHLFVSGTRLRDVIVSRVGEAGFQGLFSLLSLIGLIWLCSAYAWAPYVEIWLPSAALRWPVLVLMAAAFFFVVVGLTTPNPTAVGGESQLGQDDRPGGILGITRHPFLWGVALWGASHLAVNGDAASLVLFGSLLMLALFGTASIDAKRRRKLGDRWEPFAAQTSNVPFAAILAGRNSLRLGTIGAWRVGLAVFLYVAFLVAHPWLFGASPLPI